MLSIKNDLINNLAPEHLEDLRKSGLSDETIKDAKIYSVPPGEIGKKLGFNSNCLFQAIRPPNPRECGHLIHDYPASQSTAMRPVAGAKGRG